LGIDESLEKEKFSRRQLWQFATTEIHLRGYRQFVRRLSVSGVNPGLQSAEVA